MMARLGLSIHLHVPDGWTNMLESIAEAFQNAHIDGAEIEMRSEHDGIFHGQLPIMYFGKARANGDRYILPLTPGIGLPGFAVSVLSVLPARATVEWNGPWPIFRCPPNDDRDEEFSPEPLVPNELCLA